MHAWLTAPGRPAACRLLILFAGLHYAVHSLDVLRGPPVDVAVGIPVLAVVVVVVVIARPHSCSLVLVVPLRRRRGCRFHLLLPPAGALLLAAEQGRKKGALSSPHRRRTYRTQQAIQHKLDDRFVVQVSISLSLVSLSQCTTASGCGCIYRRSISEETDPLTCPRVAWLV
jgi:hypothetical protein